MPALAVPSHDSDSILNMVVEHVFMPPNLPQQHPGEQIEQKTNVALCDYLIEAAQDFLQNFLPSQSPSWTSMIRTMELVRSAAVAPFKEVDLQCMFSDMTIGGTPLRPVITSFVLIFLSGVFTMHIRAQNAGLIVRRPAHADFVQFEVFEVSPSNADVMTAKGKLLCSYPGPAIRVPTETFMNQSFLRELSSFLIQMDVDILDSTPTISKAGSVVPEVRETAHPKYISGLLVGILRGFGQPTDVDRITKRIGDEVLWSNAFRPWRRSPLWLVLRVTLQSSLRIDNLYKHFMLFFHAHLLRKCMHRNFPSELLYVMRAKMTRRLSKLGPGVSLNIYEFVHDTGKETEELLSKRWRAFQSIGSINHSLQPSALDYDAAAHISLTTSYNYLTGMLQPVPCGRSKISFEPHGSRLYVISDFSQFSNGRLARAIEEDQHIAIADFELSVERNLQSWVAASTNHRRAVDVIASCIQQYYAGAKELYAASSEDNSIMILTIMDLWVTLDQLTILQCPLLKEYSPEIPSDFLHPLLLHRSSAINRALHIEQYLLQRHKKALRVKFKVASVFSDAVHESSFAVKYFRASQDLKSLYEDINAHAEREREKKRAELSSLNQQSTSFIRDASRMNHECSRNLGLRRGTVTCRKCQLEHRAMSLKIHIHEWPLPSSVVHAQQAVFELSPPRSFAVWRDITYMILLDIGQPSIPVSCGGPQIRLETFSGLCRWVVKDHRVTVGSTTKSFSDQTHFKTVQIPAEESSVLVNNGLLFRLYDRIRGSWLINSFSESSIAYLCTPPIPTSSAYSDLHRFACSTQHTPNDVIAAQADCPTEINLHEFLAFSGLRSGSRLQWLNIAREL
jgi:hypothetical protein